MHNSKLNRFLPIALAMVLNLVQPGVSRAMEDTIIAIVNDDIITLRNLQDFLDSMYMKMRMEGRSPEEMRSVMREMEVNGIRKLIEERLILDKAKELGLEITDEAVNRRIEEIKKNYSSEDEFLQALVADGNSVTDLRHKVMDEYKIKAVIEQEVRSKIFVNPQEVTDYYNGHITEYQTPQRARLDSIFIDKEKDPSGAQQKAKEAYAKLKEGAAFEDVAKEYSQASSIGMIEKGQTIAKIDEAVFDLAEGTISEPIEVENGIYIFKIIQQFPSDVSPLDDVKKEIYEKLFDMKLRDKLITWLDRLKEKAYIEIKN